MRPAARRPRRSSLRRSTCQTLQQSVTLLAFKPLTRARSAQRHEEACRRARRAASRGPRLADGEERRPDRSAPRDESAALRLPSCFQYSETKTMPPRVTAGAWRRHDSVSRYVGPPQTRSAIARAAPAARGAAAGRPTRGPAAPPHRRPPLLVAPVAKGPQPRPASPSHIITAKSSAAPPSAEPYSRKSPRTRPQHELGEEEQRRLPRRAQLRVDARTADDGVEALLARLSRAPRWWRRRRW